MISIDKLQKITNVYFHASCPDGTAAAMVVAAAFRDVNPDLKFNSIQYGTKFMDDLEARPNQMFVDITPPEKRWEEWKEYNPVVLDHHETVKHVSGSLGIYGENTEFSGAQLAYIHVLLPMWKEGLIPSMTSDEIDKWRDFSYIAMVRDTWKNKHELWDCSCSQALALMFLGSKPLISQAKAGPFNFAEMDKIGDLLFSSNSRRVEMVSRGAHKTVISDGKRDITVALFNCSEKIISDVANHLIDNDGVDVAIGFFYLFEDGQQKAVISLRSNESVCVSDIAKMYGGGGHRKAAGFSLKNAMDTPPSMILSYLEKGLASMRD